MSTPPRTLTVAGSDSGGGAGLQADLRAFFACGAHGMSAVTAVTVQNSLRVSAVHVVPVDIVVGQIRAVAGDIGVDAAKTGMLATTGTVSAVAAAFAEVGIGRGGSPLVVDPVAASMHGEQLLEDGALRAYRTELFPMADLITPNLDEVRLFTGIDVRTPRQQRDAALALHEFGPQWTLVKGGHLHDDPRCTDLLYDGHDFVELTGPRHPTRHTHGSGDNLASAITVALARGEDMVSAVRYGKDYVARCVRAGYPLGAGVGPVSPRWRLPD